MGSVVKKTIKTKPSQQVTIVENELDENLTNLALAGTFTRYSRQDPRQALKSKIKQAQNKSGGMKVKTNTTEQDEDLAIKIGESKEQYCYIEDDNINHIRLSKQSNNVSKKIYMRANEINLLQK